MPEALHYAMQCKTPLPGPALLHAQRHNCQQGCQAFCVVSASSRPSVKRNIVEAAQHMSHPTSSSIGPHHASLHYRKRQGVPARRKQGLNVSTAFCVGGWAAGASAAHHHECRADRGGRASRPLRRGAPLFLCSKQVQPGPSALQASTEQKLARSQHDSGSRHGILRGSC